MIDDALISLLAASIAFVGSHFALSHPLRAPLVRALGEKGFLAPYSLVALATFAWMVVAFRANPYEAYAWDGFEDVPWAIASVLTIVATVLFLGSLVRNPSMVQAHVDDLAGREPRGVYRVTRHPMMWAFALWAVAHIIAAPTPRTLILAGAILVLALVGAALQDRKKAAQLGAGWRTWQSRTGFLPRVGALGAPGWTLWLVAILLWLGITWLHAPVGYVPSGIWKWIGINWA